MARRSDKEQTARKQYEEFKEKNHRWHARIEKSIKRMHQAARREERDATS